MVNSRSRKSAPTRPGTARDQRGKATGTRPTSRTAAVDDLTESTDDAQDSTEAVTGTPAKATTQKATAKKATAKKATAQKGTAKKAAAAKAGASSGSAGRRFGDGASTGSSSKGSASTKSTKSGGRGGRGGRPAPPVRVGPSKPWGLIAAVVAVSLFAIGAIGYAVYLANSSAIPDRPEDIKGVTIAEYTSENHVTTDQTYSESPPVGGLHDSEWADCDGAIYDEQIRSENAVHSLEHGAVWITYNPDEISDADLATLSQYVADQTYIMMSPYAGQSSLISLQSWNHQVFVDAVDDPRINEFITLLRQNPATTPEAGATCTSPTFLADPLVEGEASRAVDPAGAPATGVPATP